MKDGSVVWMPVFLFAVGIGVVFQQVLSLQHERLWFTGRQAGIAAFDGREARMLAPLAPALSIIRVLIAEGIPPRRLIAAGIGEYRPLDPAGTPAAWQRNRRIELRLTWP
jgi:hypothetical protein